MRIFTSIQKIVLVAVIQIYAGINSKKFKYGNFLRFQPA